MKLFFAAVFAVASMQAAFVQSANPLYCTVENGFEFLGLDIKNVTGADDSACCRECDATPHCTAWTWLSANDGTCRLKQDQGDIVVNKGMKSSLTPMRDGFSIFSEICQPRKNMDFEGNDLARVDGKTVQSCCDACRNFLGCRAYSWTNDQGGSCWLKSKRGKVVYKSGVYSAQVYPHVFEPLCAPRYDIDLSGKNIGQAPSTTPDACCSICSKTSGCRAYSWNNFNSGTCWLKSRTGLATTKTGVVSGVLEDAPPPICTLEDGVDYVGGDIGSELGTSTQCCGKCTERDDCVAYTWTSFNGGTCWLKNDQYKATPSSNASSGAVRA